MHREDFQIFENYKNEHGVSLVYLDTAASSLTPDVVVNAMNEYYFKYRSNIDRGLYSSAVKATEKYNIARERLARFFNAEHDEVIFTSGSTDASNKLSSMLEQKINEDKKEILVSAYAHHSDLLPLQELARRNNLQVVIANNEEEMLSKINQNTFVVSCPLASNVTGNVFDIKKISSAAHTYGAIMISDLTAAAGHIKIDVRGLDVDAAYMSAHKMCGPTGAGILYVKREILRDIQPVTFGGGMVWEVGEDTSSYRSDVRAHESGTAGIAEIIGMSAAVEYIENKNILNENKYIKDILDYAFVELGKLAEVNILSKNDNNIGIISFTVEGVHPHDVAEILARHNVAIRAGHHCAQLAMKTLGVQATCRASFYFYNTREDVDMLVEAIKDAVKILKK